MHGILIIWLRLPTFFREPFAIIFPVLIYTGQPLLVTVCILLNLQGGVLQDYINSFYYLLSRSQRAVFLFCFFPVNVSPPALIF